MQTLGERGYMVENFAGFETSSLWKIWFVLLSIVLGIPYFLSRMRIFSYVMMALLFYQWPMLARTPMVLSSLLLLQQQLILMGIYLIPYLECHLWFFIFNSICLSSFTCWFWSAYFLFIHDLWVSPYGNFLF